MEIVHPINKPELVSYHRPELELMLPALNMSLDCWMGLNTNGLASEKSKYLPKEYGEPDKAYSARVARSTYAPIYRDSIKAYAGLLSRFKLADPPSSLLEREDNVDLQGTSLSAFWSKCDELAIRDGGCFVAIDMPALTSVSGLNAYEEQNDGRYPYMIIYERKDVINWSVEYINGTEVINHVTVRVIKQKKNQKGYGVQLEPCYYVFRPNQVQLIRLEKVEGKWIEKVESTIPTTSNRVPIVWYGASTNKFAQGEMPLCGLAELSLQHYIARSDLFELLHKCAMPVPVRKGAALNSDGNYDPLIIGPNRAIDLPAEGGDFFFAEPSGKSLVQHQSEIEHIEALMDRSGLNFLYGAKIKTATEASLRGAQVASQVSALVRNKVSSFSTVMSIWAEFMGESGQLTDKSGIHINDSLISRPLDPSGVAHLVNLKKEHMLSKETTLLELQRGGALDPDVSIEEELSRIKSDQDEEDAGNPPPDGENSGPPTEDPLGNQ